jgi:hypothetical protein
MKVMLALPLVEHFRAEQAGIEAGLKAVEGASSDAGRFSALLLAMRPAVLSHFKAKDELYPALAEQALAANDSAAAQLTRIFETNMKVQSAAVRRFFEKLEVTAPALLESSFKTVASVIRARFATEGRAVFPLVERTAKVLEGK